MTETEKAGYEFAKGCFRYLTEFLAMWLLIFLLIFLFILLVKNITGFGVDSTDRSSWVRSGLRLHIDAKTGVQYLSDGNGGLIVREKAEK